MNTAKRTGVAIAGILLISCTITALFFYSDYRKAAYTGYGEPTTSKEFLIEEGESVAEIAQNLKTEGLIQNDLYFKLFVRQKNLSGSLQAGSFSIPDNLSLEEITEILQHAVFPDIWVTIPEGLMATEIADVIEQSFATNPEKSFEEETFLQLITTENPVMTVNLPIPEGKSLEGYLFPDTYRFPPDASAEYVLHSLLTTFQEKIYNPLYNDIEKSGYSLYEILIFASILERETKHPDDRPLVADILLRRHESGWALEVDATLLYYFHDWTHTITQEDLKADTLYNTRKYAGLTPTPISNPGEQAIRAVLFPESNDYWFYISDKDGILHYAVTLEEHNTNIQTYLY